MAKRTARGNWHRTLVSSGLQARMTSAQRSVMHVLIAQADRDGMARLGVGAIAELGGTTRRSVQLALQAMISAGAIDRVTTGGGRGNTACYRLRPDRWAEAPLPSKGRKRRPPSGTPKGATAISVLRVNTFGLPSTARYALPARRHQGGPPLAQRSPMELYHSLRGATIATSLAAKDGGAEDVMVALCRVQHIGAELARRLIGKHAVIERDPTAELDAIARDALSDGPLGTCGHEGHRSRGGSAPRG